MGDKNASCVFRVSFGTTVWMDREQKNKHSPSTLVRARNRYLLVTTSASRRLTARPDDIQPIITACYALIEADTHTPAIIPDPNSKCSSIVDLRALHGRTLREEVLTNNAGQNNRSKFEPLPSSPWLLERVAHFCS